jgi:hypothetical protein
VWPPHLFSSDGLARLTGSDAHYYQGAAPFPHLVLDGIFCPTALRAVTSEWPLDTPSETELHDDGTYVKLKRGSTWRTQLGPCTRHYLAEFASPPFLMALEHASGQRGLVPDPYLFGGGLHETSLGGRLAIHADFNRHPLLNLDRRLNILIYLNEGWTEQNGGELELWDSHMTACVARIAPTFNRMVVFTTSSNSFHGQPRPVNGPPGTVRRSIALYYYVGAATTKPPDPEHSTIWRRRPNEGY